MWPLPQSNHRHGQQIIAFTNDFQGLPFVQCSIIFFQYKCDFRLCIGRRVEARKTYCPPGILHTSSLPIVFYLPGFRAIIFDQLVLCPHLKKQWYNAFRLFASRVKPDGTLPTGTVPVGTFPNGTLPDGIYQVVLCQMVFGH